MQPLLSIVTINYNNLPGLQLTLDSVWMQSFKEFEHIVIDGGSIDGSRELLEKNADRFSYWVSEKDGGIFNAQNKGWLHANANYVLFLNSGDALFEAGTLEDIISCLDGTGIVYGNLMKVEPEKEWEKKYNKPLSLHYFFWETMPHQASFIRRDLLEQQGGYDESLKMCADWKFFLNAVCRYYATTHYIDKCIAKYNLEGITAQADNQQKLRNERETVWLKEWKPQYETVRALMEQQELNQSLRKKMGTMAESKLYKVYDKMRKLIR